MLHVEFVNLPEISNYFGYHRLARITDIFNRFAIVFKAKTNDVFPVSMMAA